MAEKYDVGPRVYLKGDAVATLSLSPLQNRALKVMRVWVTNPSANDTWTLLVGGRPVQLYVINTTGSQQLLGAITENVPKARNIFDWYKEQFGKEMFIPVPNGQTFTVASAGGATADVVFEYIETDIADMENVNLTNHYLGNHFITPFYLSRAATMTAVGENDFDTCTRPNYMPGMLITPAATGMPAVMPLGWTYRILALMTEGGGVNTFSGSADHRSVTEYLYAIRDGTRLWTRTTAGISMHGKASAAASANAVFNELVGPYPPFQSIAERIEPDLPHAIQVNPGETWQAGLDVTGDVTGGADYSKFLQVLLVDVTYRAQGPLVV